MSTSQLSTPMTAAPISSRPALIAALTVWDLTALAVNGIIGAGIFALPSLAARILGVSSPIAFVLCAAAVSFFVLCFAEVASHFTETGGPYLYSRAIFGPFVSFEVGWSAWLARVSSFAANSNLLLAYLAFFAPQVSSGIFRAFVLVFLAAILAIINIRGVSPGAGEADVFAGLKVAALVLFGAVGLAFVDWTRFSGMSISTNADWGGAMLLVLYAFTGFENAVIPSAEAKSPRKDTGWALVLALGVCAATWSDLRAFGLACVAGSLLYLARPRS